MATIIDSGWFVGTLSALLFVLGVVVGRSSKGAVWSLAEMRHVVEMLVQEAEQTMAQEPGEERLAGAGTGRRVRDNKVCACATAKRDG